MPHLPIRTFLLLFLLASIISTNPSNAQWKVPERDRYQTLYAMLPADIDQAGPLITAYLDSVEQVSQDSSLTKAYFLFGRLQYFKGQYRVAERFYKKALSRSDLPNMPNLYAVVSLNYGVVCDLLERLNESMKWYLNAQKIAERLKDSSLLTKVWINIALLDKRLKRFEDAIQLTLQALDVAKRRGQTNHIALCYQNLSIFHSFSGNKAKSYAYRDSALVLLRNLNDPINLGRHLVNIADDKLAEGLPDDALTYATEVLAISKSMELPDLASSANTLFARVFLMKNDVAKSEFHFKEARKLAQSIENLELEENVLASMIDLYVKSKRFEDYQKAFADYLDVGNKLHGLVSEARFEELKVLYELDKASLRNEALKKENNSLQRQRILLFAIASILLIGGTWIYRQHRKLSGFVKSLFMLNIEKAHVSELGGLPLSNIEQADSIAAGPPSLDDEAKNAQQELDDTESLKRYQQIVSLITEQRLFTDPEFNIQKLTSLMGSNQKYISQAINRHSNRSFNGFINRLRVNEARRKMIENPNSSLVVIMEESGFGNRVTFYRQFKDITGFSPSEFQALLLSPPVTSTDM